MQPLKKGISVHNVEESSVGTLKERSKNIIIINVQWKTLEL